MSEAPASGQAPNRITIVIPVYGDWASLRSCIQSLIDHANPAEYDVLIVNDCGPDADELEAGIRGMIFGRDNFRYERNPENLGFVRTCNRATYELDRSGNDILLLNSDTRITPGALDELRTVLYLSERHAVVCPRSNDATIATIPFFQREASAERDAERTRIVFDAISAELPRYYIAPVAIGFCFLIRRSLIDNHGLFDEVFGKGYNEENDFCLRLNALGYSSIIANHALVFHVGSTSFGSEQRAALEAANSRVLHERYPFYPQAVGAFIRNEYTAVDRFADLLVEGDLAQPPKILIDLHHLTLAYDGSTRNALSFLEYLSQLPQPLVANVTVAAPASAIEFFDLHHFGVRVIEHSTIDEVFDVGVALAPVTDLTQLIALNRFSLRWAVSYLDIIALRSWALRIQAPDKVTVVHHALRHADRVIAISRATVDDALKFYPDLADILPQHTSVIHQGSGSTARQSTAEHAQLSTAIDPQSAEAIVAGGYVLVVGNAYPHKQVPQALKALEKTGMPIVAFGPQPLKEKFPGAHVLPAGTLSDSDVAELNSQAHVVVFPSAYEGFGLPLVEAVNHGRRVIVFDTAVAREVVGELGLDSQVTFFSRFDLLADAVRTALAEPSKPTLHPVRSLRDYNAEVWDAILDVSSSPVGHQALTARDESIRALSLVWDRSRNALNASISELSAIKSSNSFTLARRIAGITRLLRRTPRPEQ